MKAESAKAKELARDHWGYVQDVLRLHGQSDELINIVGFHYIAAMIHGVKHGIELERNGLFRPSIGEPLSAEEVADISERVETDIVNVKPCASCDAVVCSADFMLAAETMGVCPIKGDGK
jgi:hypothetical protein